MSHQYSSQQQRNDRLNLSCPLATLAVISLILVAFFVVMPQSAYAHAELRRSEPANGEQLETAPTEVVIYYTQGVQIATITVEDAEGQLVSQEPQIDSADWQIVHIPLLPIGDGVYTVQWEALAEDGHITEGSFFFLIGAATLDRTSFVAMMEQNTGAAQINPLEPFLRGFLFLALILLIGVPITLLAVISPALKGQKEEMKLPDEKIKRLLNGAAILLLLSATLLFVSQLVTAYGIPSLSDMMTFFSATTAGITLLIRLLAGVVLLAILRSIATPPRHTIWYLTSIVTGLIALLTISWGSHTAAATGGIAILSDIAHLAGAALWGGGLVVLAILLPPLLQDKAGESVRELTSTIISRFSRLAIIGLGIAVVTGFLLTSYHVPSWNTLFSTFYGYSLSSKLLLFAVALGLAGLNRFVILRQLRQSAEPSQSARGFIRSVRVELAFVIGVFFLAGLLTSAPPANVATAAPESKALVLSQKAKDIDVQLEIAPVEVGMNLFDVSFSQNGQPILAENIEKPVLLLRHADAELQLPQSSLEAIEPGLYSILTSFTQGGRWRVRVGGLIDGKFIAETFLVDVASPEAEQMDSNDMTGMDHSQMMMQDQEKESRTPFQSLMVIMAVVSNVLVILALAADFRSQRTNIKET